MCTRTYLNNFNFTAMQTKFKIFIKLVLLFAGLIFSYNLQAQTNWKNLFNGKDFSGWEVKNGTAEYTIEGDAIVGTSKTGTPNTFLCTKKNYSDFILEVEVYVTAGLNSGIQFRSNSFEDYKGGRVHGYQSELDTSPRAWTGGIYDEGRRGWLYPLTTNKKGSAAFVNGTWNKVRIEAIGNEIKTFINGIQCANLVDDMTSEGFIALQVHSIRDKSEQGKNIKWKNIRILTENLEANSTPSHPYARQISYLNNQLTVEEKRKGWRLLWDGKTSKGWKGAKMDSFPKQGINIEDGTIHFLAHNTRENPNGAGDIITEEVFSNFELELDFLIQKGGNSGVKYFVGDSENTNNIGLEFQILDNAHSDFNEGVGGNRTMASLYDLIAANNLSEKNRNDIRANSAGSWNKARLVVKGGRVEHWINNIKVVTYDRFSQIFKNLIQKSKYAEYSGFGMAIKGRVLLQDHHPGDIKFKNIKIREF